MKKQSRTFFTLALKEAGGTEFIFETAAKKPTSTEKKIFSTADMWNIHRRNRKKSVR